MLRRSFIAFGALAVLTACVDPLINEQTSADLKVADVKVDASGAKVVGRQVALSSERIARDVRNQVLAQLRSVTNGSRPVNVEIEVTSVQLVSPGQAILVGGVSTITGIAKVTDARTGEIVVAQTKVFGGSKTGYAPGGLIGAAIQAGTTPEDDYTSTVAGFAIDVRRRMIGK